MCCVPLTQEKIAEHLYTNRGVEEGKFIYSQRSTRGIRERKRNREQAEGSNEINSLADYNKCIKDLANNDWEEWALEDAPEK